jgi:hypothetical protein
VSARDSVLKVDPMKSTRVVARMLGGMLFISGAGILLNSEGYRATADEFLRGVGLIYMSGMMALVAGLSIVYLHNVWTKDWRTLLTLIGWFAVIDGILRVVVPEFIQRFDTWYIAQPGFLIGSGFIVLALGLFLSFKGLFV